MNESNPNKKKLSLHQPDDEPGRRYSALGNIGDRWSKGE
jgi:hypothetical protein